MDLHILRFSDYGKEFPKHQNMSPDAFIQLALQLSYYKVHRRLVSTYESASIRRFRLGRVDNIRACTMEALEWARAMTGETITTDENKMELLRDAMKRQTDILVQTILGHGIDNHLLGLKQIAEELERDCPAVFKDESYGVANQFTMSTSQASVERLVN
ncbi:Choline O-acetyltransferase [Lamellibrachia satsuma]|nr:Choline O-acetyltransferase [Lamellibrachia satsuma]